jgi:hypothetical protein
MNIKSTHFTWFIKPGWSIRGWLASSLILIVQFIMMTGCTGFSPQHTDVPVFSERVVFRNRGDLRIGVAVPTAEESKKMFGVDLYKKQIQPIWLYVKNSGQHNYWLLPSGMDPEHFSPSEAAFGFRGNSTKTNQEIVDHFQNLHFKNPITPNSSKEGYILVNLDEGFKAVDIDLLSQNSVENFTFIFEDPEFKGDFRLINFNDLYAEKEIITIENEDALRDALESLPCCTTNSKGNKNGDPINVILVGSFQDVGAALVRRNWHPTEIIWSKAIWRTIRSFLKNERYRYSPVSPLYVFGRQQDMAWQKARGNINRRNHIRIWLSPFQYQGKSVFIGQISRDIGVKFTFKSSTISTHIIDPDVDEARRYFVEDMIYSQAVTKLGIVKGVGRIEKDNPQLNLGGDPYFSDGFRAVLFFDSRPYSLTDIEIANWENPLSISQEE